MAHVLWRAPVRAAAAAIVILTAVPGIALAHPTYETSEPPDNGTVSSPPSQVWAEYSEPLVEESSYLQVYDPCGIRVDDGSTVVTGYRMTVGMSGERSGTYVVRWQAHSSVDSHIVTGQFTFASNGGQPCPGAEPERRQRAPGSEPRGSQGDGAKPGGEQVAAAGRAKPSDERRAGRRKQGAGAGQRERNEREEPEAADAAVPPRAAPDTAPTSVFEGIPAEGAVIALVACVLIGIAGGFVYAGIMGPRRRDL